MRHQLAVAVVTVCFCGALVAGCGGHGVEENKAPEAKPVQPSGKSMKSGKAPVEKASS